MNWDYKLDPPAGDDEPEREEEEAALLPMSRRMERVAKLLGRARTLLGASEIHCQAFDVSDDVVGKVAIAGGEWPEEAVVVDVFARRRKTA